MKLDNVYEEKVYAGVLGKIIGVYLGRPFEGWTYDRIMSELGPINYYVHDKLKVPLIVTDDDITGTFTFIRALNDYNYNYNVTSRQIGQTWLNNIIEKETILWWGGVGNSTEHTAYQNLINGIPAPESGSIKKNGKVIAEQIGAQIFIDGWAMVCPGDPEKAIDLAGRAAKVSHDGEAVFGAQIIAALESLAFIENDINKLLNVSKKLIPNSSTIYKLINDIQDWHAGNSDWKRAREKIQDKYGYDKFLGNCHMVPNHALIIMSLLYGEDNFQKSLMIVNTAGWDTDCNSGNVGCILGIKNGLQGIDSGPDWRSPVADRLYLPTANGGQSTTDAVTETYKLIKIAKLMNHQKFEAPKTGYRYHFEMPGSLQGFKVDLTSKNSQLTYIKNVEGHSKSGKRSLQITYDHLSNGVDSKVYVDTFIPKEIHELEGHARNVFFHYNLYTCSNIYSGQIIKAKIIADKNNKQNIFCNLYIRCYSKADKLISIESEKKLIKVNSINDFSWKLPGTNGDIISQIGLRISSSENSQGKIYLDYLGWEDEPKVSFFKPNHVVPFQRGQPSNKIKNSEMWRNNWVKATDHWDIHWKEAFHISNNNGRGMIITGTNDWKNYTVSSKITFHLMTSGGIVARVQGLRRYYSLEASKQNKIRLVKMFEEIDILEEKDFAIQLHKEYLFSLSVKDNFIRGLVDGILILEYNDDSNMFQTGGIGLVIENGTLSTNEILVN